MHIYIINGPNLNMIGQRDVNIYGRFTYKELLLSLKKQAKKMGVKVSFFQSNYEGKLIDYIQKNIKKADGIIINPGALTHSSIALRDCLELITKPIVEVHISDIYNREDFRRINYIKDLCCHSIINQGIEGYNMALKYIVSR